jgi:hypothetical protein
VREALDRLLKDLTLTTVALAIALGWSLYQFAAGVSELVATLFIDYGDDLDRNLAPYLPLTWQVGHRVLTFDRLLRGSIELAVVLGVAAYVRHRGDATRNRRQAR